VSLDNLHDLNTEFMHFVFVITEDLAKDNPTKKAVGRTGGHIQ
jgi:hypothetical protein